jgi:hypothetical protein
VYGEPEAEVVQLTDEPPTVTAVGGAGVVPTNTVLVVADEVSDEPFVAVTVKAPLYEVPPTAVKSDEIDSTSEVDVMPEPSTCDPADTE